MKKWILIFSLMIPNLASAALLDDLKDIKEREHQKALRAASAMSQALASELESLRNDYLEARARTDLLDRLIFFYDTHYKGGDERKFLRFASLTIAEREVKNPDFTQQKYWIFLRNFAQVLESQRESGQSPGASLQTYMAYSDVLNPKDPQGYLRGMDYTNGLDNESIEDIKKLNELRISVETSKSLSAPKLKPVVISSEPSEASNLN